VVPPPPGGGGGWANADPVNTKVSIKKATTGIKRVILFNLFIFNFISVLFLIMVMLLFLILILFCDSTNKFIYND